MSEVEGSTLFSSLQYYIAGKITPEAQEILDKGAAKSNSYLSELVKISITDTTDNEDEYSEITDIYDIPVVSCDWVILSHKCGKLLPTKPFPPKQTSDQLFANKVFAASHVERSDLDSLWAMITFHGGSTQRSMTENATHLLCTDTKGKKYGLSENKFKVKVVTPDWVVDCIRAKKLISEIEYHPKLLVNSSNMLQRIVSPAIPLATAKVTVPISSTTASQPTTPSSATFPTISDYPLPPPAKTTSKSPVHRKKATPKASQPSPSPMISPPPVDFHSGLSHVAPGYLQQPRFTPPPTTMPPLSNAQQPLRSRQVSPQFLSHMGQGTYSPNPPHPEQQSTQPERHVNRGLQKAPVISHHTTLPSHPNMPPHPNISHYPNLPSHMLHPSSDSAAYPPIHYTGAAARQSPVSPGMARHPLNSHSQRSSPGSSRTPPMLNLGHMTEVPYPSQASLPEETPIIRMTNMAAFPMGSEVSTVPQRKSPIASGKSSSRSHSQSKSPVNAQPFNVSVIKPTKSAGSVGETGSRTPTSADRSPASSVTRLTPPVTNMVTAHAGGSEANDTPVLYYGYDSTESLPTDMCLAGCIFYMGEYLKTDPCEQWIMAIEENGGTVDPSYSNRVTHVLAETQASDACQLALNDHKRVVTAHWLNDVIGKHRMEPPWRAHHLPHPHSSGLQLCANQVVGVTGFCLEERWILHAFVRMIGASFTNYLARSNTVLICKKLEGEKVTKAQEWGIECVNVQWLSELVLGNLRALKLPIDRKYKVFNKPDDFTIDQSMAASVMSGWRVPLKIPKDNCRKFKPSSKSTEAGWDNKRKADGDTFTHPNKRIKLQEIQNTSSNLPKGHRPHVVLTGYTVREKEKYSDIVRSLGGVVCEDVRKCTHLIAEKVLRTPNFLLAMNYCSYISSSDWITESMKSGHFVDERVFTLQNSDAGSMWNILEALERRNNQGKPFADLQFHLTPGVSLSTSLSRNFLLELITAAGGSIQSPDEKRWSVRKILENVKNSHNGKPTYIVISCKDDVHICMDILRANQDVYSVEFILSGVMNQVAPYDAVLCVKETKQAN